MHDADQHVARLIARERWPALLARVHALVGELQRVVEAGGLIREQHRAVGRRHGEVLAALLERARGDGEDRVQLSRLGA